MSGSTPSGRSRSVSSASPAGRWSSDLERARRESSVRNPIIGLYWDGACERKGDVVRCWWQPEFEAFISGARVMMMHNGYTFADGSTESMHSPDIEGISHWAPLDYPAEPPQ